MKKIPTLFEREFENHKVVKINGNIHPGMEWVLKGEGEATIKWDGSCCAMIMGMFYKRFDAKKGRKIPDGAIACCDPDPVTGHWPCWVPVTDCPADQWFIRAKENYERKFGCALTDGTYEAIGPHFNANRHKMETDTLRPHGIDVVEVERTFAGIRKYLEENMIEGLVFWKDGIPECKIKRSDFGLDW